MHVTSLFCRTPQSKRYHSFLIVLRIRKALFSSESRAFLRPEAKCYTCVTVAPIRYPYATTCGIIKQMKKLHLRQFPSKGVTHDDLQKGSFVFSDRRDRAVHDDRCARGGRHPDHAAVGCCVAGLVCAGGALCHGIRFDGCGPSGRRYDRI